MIKTKKNKTIYLASPYGFADQWRLKLLPEFFTKLESMGATVYEPFSRNSHIDLSIPGWANKVAIANYKDLHDSDAFFAIVNGSPPDEGVMIELGIAIALKKKIFLFRDDFRNCSDSNQYPLNLMLFLGLPKDNWKKYYFESLQDIKSNKKGFMEWAKK